jgi:CheY-like chemotaxis protein
MEVKVAKSGQKAIHLHSQGASFDLILMDMDMPAHVTSGYEVEFFDLQLRRIYFRSLRQSLKEETTTIR